MILLNFIIAFVERYRLFVALVALVALVADVAVVTLVMGGLFDQSRGYIRIIYSCP